MNNIRRDNKVNAIIGALRMKDLDFDDSINRIVDGLKHMTNKDKDNLPKMNLLECLAGVTAEIPKTIREIGEDVLNNLLKKMYINNYLFSRVGVADPENEEAILAIIYSATLSSYASIIADKLNSSIINDKNALDLLSQKVKELALKMSSIEFEFGDSSLEELNQRNWQPESDLIQSILDDVVMISRNNPNITIGDVGIKDHSEIEKMNAVICGEDILSVEESE